MLLAIAQTVCDYLNDHGYQAESPVPHYGMSADAYHGVCTRDGHCQLACCWYYPDKVVVEWVQKDISNDSALDFTILEYANPALLEQILQIVQEQLRAKLHRADRRLIVLDVDPRVHKVTILPRKRVQCGC